MGHRYAGIVFVSLLLTPGLQCGKSEKREAPGGNEKAPAFLQSGSDEKKSLTPEQQESRKQNVLGFKKYKMKDYAAARDYFQKAAGLDPQYATAHYNLACMNSLINEFCDYDDAKALKSLERAIQLDPDYAKKAIHDSDLKNISDTYVFKRLTKQIQSDADVVRYLTGVGKVKKCYSPGAYSICTEYSFLPDGKLVMTVNTPPMGDAGNVRFEKKTGTYRVENNHLILTIEGQKNEPIQLDEWLHPSNDDRCSA